MLGRYLFIVVFEKDEIQKLRLLYFSQELLFQNHCLYKSLACISSQQLSKDKDLCQHEF